MLGWTLWDVSGRFATFGNWRSLGTFREVGGHFATFGDVWGCLGMFWDVWNIFINKFQLVLRMMQYCIMLSWAWVGIADVLVCFGTFLDVFHCFWMFLDVLQHFGTFCNILQHYMMFPNVL